MPGGVFPFRKEFFALRPGALPRQSRGKALRGRRGIFSAAQKVNCPAGAREATPGCAARKNHSDFVPTGARGRGMVFPFKTFPEKWKTAEKAVALPIRRSYNKIYFRSFLR